MRQQEIVLLGPVASRENLPLAGVLPHPKIYLWRRLRWKGGVRGGKEETNIVDNCG